MWFPRKGNCISVSSDTFLFPIVMVDNISNCDTCFFFILESLYLGTWCKILTVLSISDFAMLSLKLVSLSSKWCFLWCLFCLLNNLEFHNCNLFYRWHATSMSSFLFGVHYLDSSISDIVVVNRLVCSFLPYF